MNLESSLNGYTSWKAHGWGWDEPGNWSPGNYRVEVWINNEKIGAGSFTIVDDTSTKTVEFDSLRFFEGGYTAPDTVPFWERRNRMPR